MKPFFITFFLICLIQTVFSQNNNQSQLKTISNKVIENIIAADKERTLITTDRKMYAAGETIYFKAYLIDSMHNYLRSTPVKLYVDYVDENDSAIKTIILNNSVFQTSGQFVLPDSLPEGFYWMRVYTKEMVKSNTSNIAVETFYVVNKSEALKQPVTTTPTTKTINKTVLKISPEGGSVISGINSTFAVSAKNNYGRPQIISGIIKNNNNDSVGGFTTNQYGLAKFSYFAKWFYRYSVFIKNGDKYDSTTGLPKINFYAAQLSVIQQTNNYVTLQVALEDSIYTKNYTTYILGINRDSVCFASVGKGMYTAQVPVSKLPGGIQTFYLFNTNEQLISSRSVYIKKENYHLIINADKNNYVARNAIRLNLHLTDAHDNPEIAALSLSVVDKNAIVNEPQLLKNDDTLQYLSANEADLIMLTQTEEINPLLLPDTSILYQDEDSGFVTSGTVMNTKNQPVEKCIVTILSAKPALILETDTSDANGKFKFNLPGLYDSTQFTIQLTDTKGKSLSEDHVVFDKDSVIQFSTPANLRTTFTLSDSMQSIKLQLLNSASILSPASGKWLKPVTVKTYKKPQVNYDESKRVSRNSQIFSSDMLREGANMTSIILLNNPGVRRLFFGPKMIGGDPLIVLDGNEIPKKEVINEAAAIGENPIMQFVDNIPVSTIDFIEVLTGGEAASYGMEGGHGVILINTKSGSEGLPSGVTLKNFYAKGFYNNKPFEMPDYSNKQILKSKLPDLRKTIYWNGSIVTNKDGDTSVEFFAADAATSYVVTINGITVNGDRIFKTFTISRN